MQRGEIKNPIMLFVLTFVTCGIFGFVWLHGACKDINRGLGRDEFELGRELVLTVITCGLWGVWFAWRLSESTVELQREWGVQPALDTPWLWATFLCGLGPVFVQSGLNNAWENGAPGGARGSW